MPLFVSVVNEEKAEYSVFCRELILKLTHILSVGLPAVRPTSTDASYNAYCKECFEAKY